MLRNFFIFTVFILFTFYVATNGISTQRCWKTGTSRFGCFGATRISVLDKAPTTVRTIWLEHSQFTNIPDNTFHRFRNNLKSLDMHLTGIQTIDSKAFNGLTHLQNLTLWGNSLEAVWSIWFTNLTQLTTLDLSFNRISYIEETVFTMIPNIENLYLDSNNLVVLNWNVFSYLGNLKRVKLGKNPWNWWYRAQIARQLDNQHVDYRSEWDDYNWINHIAWVCMEKHQANYMDDSVSDCAVSYLLEEFSKINSNFNTPRDCEPDAKALYDCAMTTGQSQNVTITPNVAIRKILQGYIGAYQSMRNPAAIFTERIF